MKVDEPNQPNQPATAPAIKPEPPQSPAIVGKATDTLAKPKAKPKQPAATAKPAPKPADAQPEPSKEPVTAAEPAKSNIILDALGVFGWR